MARRPGFLAASVLAIGFGFVANAHAESCTLKRYASFDIPPRPDDGGAVSIPVSVNGSQEKFLVDTGGFYSMISPSVAKTLNLTARSVNRFMEIYAADGAMINQYVNVHPLKIGGLHFNHVRLLLEPDKGVAHPRGFAGVLADDLLGRADLDFDFGADKLNLIDQDHCKGEVVYWAPAYAVIPFTLAGHHINLEVTLDGKTLSATIDTGSTYTLLSASAASQKFGLGAGSPGMLPIDRTEPNALVPYHYRFKNLSLNGVAARNLDVGIILDKVSEAFGERHNDKSDFAKHEAMLNVPDLTIGMDVLRKLHLYIAYGEQNIYVTVANAGHASATASAKSSGRN